MCNEDEFLKIQKLVRHPRVEFWLKVEYIIFSIVGLRSYEIAPFLIVEVTLPFGVSNANSSLLFVITYTATPSVFVFKFCYAC